MRLTSLLWSMLPAVLPAAPQHDLSTSGPVVPIKSAPAASAPSLPSFGSISDYADSPRTPRRVTFTLQSQIYQWLEAMAVTHNYGSVHKSLRDLLEWANTGNEDDMQWIFATPHHIPEALQLNACNRLTDVSCIAGKQACIKDDVILLHARLNDALYQWIVDCVRKYQLRGPSHMLDTLVRCAIELDAEHDIFDSPECGRDLASTSAELYHDLGIMRYTANDGVQFSRLR